MELSSWENKFDDHVLLNTSPCFDMFFLSYPHVSWYIPTIPSAFRCAFGTCQLSPRILRLHRHRGANRGRVTGRGVRGVHGFAQGATAWGTGSAMEKVQDLGCTAV